jgi:uncharacterized damage-inducible protein DinB
VTHDDILNLLDFHYWARDRMLDAVEVLTPEQYTQDLGSSYRSVRDTVVHIYAAEWIWHLRWLGQSPTALLTSEQVPDFAAIRRAWVDHERLVRVCVENIGDDVGRVIPYTLLNGTSSASPFWQLLQHVVNHASYHRGQVTTMLRQLGVPAGKSTDMVLFHRERSASG